MYFILAGTCFANILAQLKNGMMYHPLKLLILFIHKKYQHAVFTFTNYRSVSVSVV